MNPLRTIALPSPSPGPPLQSGPDARARLLGAASAAIGAFALAGWALDVTVLTSGAPGLATMKANTALCAVLGGVALWAASVPGDGAVGDGSGARRVALGAASLLALLAGVSVAQYAFGFDAGVDQLLVRDSTSAAGSPPGRMAPNTAVAYLLLGGALLLHDPRATRPGPGQWLALVAAAIGFAALVGYLYSATVLYRLSSFTGMALPTALSVSCLGVGVTLAGPSAIGTRLTRSPGGGGGVTRRLLPAVVLAPLVIGWLRLQAEQAGYLGAELGVAVMVTSVVVVLTLVLYASLAQVERVEGARGRAEELFRHAVEASPHGVLMVDPHGELVLANQQTHEIFGYDPGELVGRRVEMLLPESRREMHEGHRAAFARDPSARRMGAGRDLRGRRRDGSEIPVEVGLNPLSLDGRPHVLASVVDITERKAIEDELRRSNEELERFAYVASHDLQEPLRMVASYVQLLARRYEGKLDSDADDFIGFALDGALRARRLIEELLAFSRVGTHGGAPLPTDAGAALDHAIADLRGAIDEAGATVTRGPLPTVLADPVQLERVFLNLVGNALKFRGPDPVEVHVSAARSGDGQWTFSVRDNGIGIDAEYFDRIFVIFQRLHGIEDYPGTGMGLALTRRIVERHGGRIWVESEPGRGSVFRFTLNAIEEVGR